MITIQYVCQKTLEAVLENGGTMQGEEVLNHNLPVPRGDCWEGLYIDDHVVLQVFSHRDPLRKPLRDRTIVKRAEKSWKT